MGKVQGCMEWKKQIPNKIGYWLRKQGNWKKEWQKGNKDNIRLFYLYMSVPFQSSKRVLCVRCGWNDSEKPVSDVAKEWVRDYWMYVPKPPKD